MSASQFSCLQCLPSPLLWWTLLLSYIYHLLHSSKYQISSIFILPIFEILHKFKILQTWPVQSFYLLCKHTHHDFIWDSSLWKFYNIWPIILDCFFIIDIFHISGINLPLIFLLSLSVYWIVCLVPILACVAARHHRSSPAASLGVEKLYGGPTLYSGLATLVLSQSELHILSHCQRQSLLRIQGLHWNTASAALYFLSGSLD